MHEGPAPEVPPCSGARTCRLAPGADCRGVAHRWRTEYHGNLRDARFTAADLRGADFRGADLSGAILQGTTLQNVRVIYSVDTVANAAAFSTLVKLAGAQWGNTTCPDGTLTDTGC